jgi:hypothetical protein
MGMFDYVRCEVPIKGILDSTKKEYQTKDMECYLDTYVITSYGALLRYSFIEDGSAEEIEPEFMEDYTNTLNFSYYDIRMIRCKASFKEGRLIRVWVV